MKSKEYLLTIFYKHTTLSENAFYNEYIIFFTPIK